LSLIDSSKANRENQRVLAIEHIQKIKSPIYLLTLVERHIGNKTQCFLSGCYGQLEKTKRSE